jgi:hypothetical protein
MDTSSLFDCFCLLALIVDPPVSLCDVGVDSNAGRGILEAGLLLKTGNVPRPCPRLGVPLMVPLEAMIDVKGRMEVETRNAKRLFGAVVAGLQLPELRRTNQVELFSGG